MKTPLLIIAIAALPALAQDAQPASTPAPATESPATAPAAPVAPVSPEDNLPEFSEGAVYLFNGEKFIRMDRTPYAVVGRAAFVTVVIILKVPGTSADIRVKRGRQPFILLGGSTKGGQLVRFTVDRSRRDPHREIRMIGEGVITETDRLQYRDEKLDSGWHKIYPSQAIPGEYAWVPFVGTNAAFIYDYGVDSQ